MCLGFRVFSHVFRVFRAFSNLQYSINAYVPAALGESVQNPLLYYNNVTVNTVNLLLAMREAAITQVWPLIWHRQSV